VAIDAGDTADAALGAAINRAHTCGYLRRGESVGLEISLANQRVSQAFVGIEDCRTRACFRRKGGQIERAAAAAIQRIEPLAAKVESPCLRKMVATGLSLLRTYEHFGKASIQLNAEVMDRDSARATSLFVSLGRQVQRCAASVG
jgi:hypothetical protein